MPNEQLYYFKCIVLCKKKNDQMSVAQWYIEPYSTPFILLM